jgi:hypothetical protein
VSPILVRPVREQLEHDRIIRLLPGKYRRRYEVGINPGSEQTSSIGTGTKAIYPDAILYSTERGRKLMGVVEVETGESINHLEAMAQWAHLARLRVPFHLYVPVGSVDVARRLSDDHQITVSEIWTYDHIGDQVRFTLIFKAPEHARSAPRAAASGKPPSAKPPSSGKPASAGRPAAGASASSGAGAGKAAAGKSAQKVAPAKASSRKAAGSGRTARPRAAAPRGAAPARSAAKAAKAAPPARKTSSKRSIPAKRR